MTGGKSFDQPVPLWLNCSQRYNVKNWWLKALAKKRRCREKISDYHPNQRHQRSKKFVKSLAFNIWVNYIRSTKTNAMRFLFILFLLFFNLTVFSSHLLVPMDTAQKNHLKAYGLVYKLIEKKQEVNLLVNYRGGSYLVEESEFARDYCTKNGIIAEPKTRKQYAGLLNEVNVLQNNTTVLTLTHLPKVGFYETSNHNDVDVVEMLFNYAGIPYAHVTEAEILNGKLGSYDWLYIHHEDFTGQYNKFVKSYKNTDWLKKTMAENEKNAADLGFGKVSHMKLAVAKEIKKWIGNGGFLFSMCSATDSYDVALAAEETDICPHECDGDPVDTMANTKLKYENCLAFKDFNLVDPYSYGLSGIDPQSYHATRSRKMTLKDIAITQSLMESIAIQNHRKTMNSFAGITSAFKPVYLKENVQVLMTVENSDFVKMLMGRYGKGYFTFYPGHDPEKERSYIGATPDVTKFPNSPGYRMILNNMFLPGTNYASLAANEAPAEINLGVTPNPFTDRFTLTISQAKEKQFAVYVTDVNGKQVKFIAEKEFLPKEQLDIDLSDLNTGIYFVFLRDESNKLISKKIVKL